MNSLSDGTGYSAENAENNAAALYLRETLVINGSGTLNVTGNYKDGINSRDGQKLCGGIINVNAIEDGIIGKDYLLGASGTVTVNSGCDGLKSTNSTDQQKGYISITDGSYTLNCGRDGIQAETNLNISGGTIYVRTRRRKLHSRIHLGRPVRRQMGRISHTTGTADLISAA